MNLQKLSVLLFCFIALSNCAQENDQKSSPIKSNMSDSIRKSYALGDYLSESEQLNKYVDSVIGTLDEKAIIAQLIMPAAGKYGKSKTTIDGLIKDQLIGGILMLNGTKKEFTSLIAEFNQDNIDYGNLPFLYSADAEPSLVNRKITGSTPVKKANEIDSLQGITHVAETISKDLNDIGINYNFAPVVDMSKNSTVGYRGFGKDPINIIPWSDEFIKVTQENNIIATAKHFPGHGLVSGDTHKSLQVIDGELKEVINYPLLIENGVLSIMVAHIAIENNPTYSTNGLPSTCSKKIVSSLLRDSLNFKGIIVTDAMGMGGVVKVPNSSVKAIEAGCDILLMPVDARKAHKEIWDEFKNGSDAFRNTVIESAKRIIRMKVCLGLI
jgi:beta-N-acetylhexosaminidase